MATAILATPIAETIKRYVGRNSVRDEKRLEQQLEKLDTIIRDARAALSDCTTAFSGPQAKNAGPLDYIQRAMVSLGGLRDHIWERKTYFVDDADYYALLEKMETQCFALCGDFMIQTNLVPLNEQEVRTDFQKRLNNLQPEVKYFLTASEIKHKKLLGIEDKVRRAVTYIYFTAFSQAVAVCLAGLCLGS